MNYNVFSVNKGHYDFAHPSDWQTALWFTLRDDAPFERKRLQFTHDSEQAAPEEYTGLSVLEAAQLCQKCIDRYLYNSDKPRIAALVTYLETTAREDHIATLTHELELLDERRADIMSELDELKAVQS